jgi:hypothetical protein
LEHGEVTSLVSELGGTPNQFRGFAFEGAAMALGLLDYLTPWRRNRVKELLRSGGAAHLYMVHVGVGWAVARLGRNIERARAQLDPLLGWLAVDGYGFHEGFFKWPRYLRGQPCPRRVLGYARRVFDHRLGRSLWFINGGDTTLIAGAISGFPAERRADLWSGVGLSSAYAGGVDEVVLRKLLAAADRYQPQLAQGAAFAAKARQRANNVTPYTEMAVGVLCDLSAAEAAQVTDTALENLPATGPEPAYEVWRCRIQSEFVPHRELRL